MENIPIMNARNDLFQLAEKTVKNGTPIRITSKKGDVVLISASDWDAIQEALFLNVNREANDSILEGIKAPLSEFVDDIEWSIK